MSYCINPNCSHRQNPDDFEFCQTCGTKLLINERYRIVKMLRVGQIYNSEVFEVKDLSERESFKILKSLAPKFNNSKAAELFEKEAQVLIWLSADWHKNSGIPKVKPDAYFSCGITNNLKQLRCLVMEKIEGQNLEQWLEVNQGISQEQAINWLEQLIKILDKVHQQGLWHRDIKPSNIMLKPDGQLVLIDFGAVGIGSTIIASAEYTPPEQTKGATVLQSDFFAVGRTFVYLLTGKHPHELPKSLKTEQLIWRGESAKISEELANLIDDLMAASPENRPQNTQEILQRLQAINYRNLVTLSVSTTTISKVNEPVQTSLQGNNNRLKHQVKLVSAGAIIISLGLAATVIYHILPCQIAGIKPCNDTENLSFGNKILVPGPKKMEKLAGVNEISAGNFSKAVSWFNKSLTNYANEPDPETLIYLNNAQIETQQRQVYTIAVLAPLSGSNDNISTGIEILKGVAQAQNEVNQDKKNKVSLKVLIANDKNDLEQGKRLADELGKKIDILGVVGHVTSDISLAVVDIYQKNQLVLVSPTSTADQLSAKSKTEKNFFFRTVSSDRITAQALTNYLNFAKQRKAAVYYNSNSEYSSSIRDQFKNDFATNGGSVIEFDLSTFLFSAAKTMEEAKKQGISALVFLPDSTTRTKVVEVIKTNSSRYLMLGGDTVYNPDILKMGAQDAVNLVAAIPWQISNDSNGEFFQTAQKLWGQESPVSWRTAMAYDATRTLIAAIEKTSNPDRDIVQQTLSNPNFIATGATGEIRFRTNGDRKDSQMQLVKVVKKPQGKLVFVPLQTPP